MVQREVSSFKNKKRVPRTDDFSRRGRYRTT